MKSRSSGTVFSDVQVYTMYAVPLEPFEQTVIVGQTPGFRGALTVRQG